MSSPNDGGTQGDAGAGDMGASEAGPDGGSVASESGLAEAGPGDGAVPADGSTDANHADTGGSADSSDGAIVDAGSGNTALTNATLFRVDSSGTNLNSTSNGHIARGVWNTKTGVQNVPGNYVVRLFLATSSNPGPNDLFPLANALSAALLPGDNTFYILADRDDMAGGTYGFGLNVWLNGAMSGSPSISTFVGTGDAGAAFSANATTGCTAGYDAVCIPGSNTLSWTQGGHTVTMTSFSISAVGGAGASASCVDKVGADNTSPAVTNMPNGLCDTVGSFTLTVQ